MHQGVRLSGRRRSFVMRPRRRRPVIIAVVVAALVIALGAAGGELPVAAAHRREPEPDRGRLPVRLAAGRLPGHGQGQPERPAFRAGRPAEAGRRRARRPAAPPVARPGDHRRRIRSGAVHCHGRPGQRSHLAIPRPAAPHQQEPALVGELEPGRDISGAAPRATGSCSAPRGRPGAGARGRRHRAQLPGGDRQVRVPRAADRQRGRGHRRRGEDARPPVQGGRRDRPGRDRAGLPAAAGGPPVADHPHRGPGPPRRRHRGALPRGGREARADEHRHADAAGRVAGRVLRGDGQAG